MLIEETPRPLPEDDHLVLRCVLFVRAGSTSYYFNELSPAQFLRLLDPEAAVAFGDDGATVAEALTWLEDPENPDFSGVIEGELALWTHDRGELTLRAPTGYDLRRYAAAILTSRGVPADSVLDAAEAHPRHYVAFDPAGQVQGIYEDFDAYLARKPAAPGP